MSDSVGNNPSPTILIVDDNPVVTAALARLLHKEGYRTAVFNCGHDALVYTEHHTNADAAIIDIHLPDLSGLILTSKLRRILGPTKPIIILSGDTSMENLRSLPHVGATFFISKPFKSDYLVTRLKELGVASL